LFEFPDEFFGFLSFPNDVAHKPDESSFSASCLTHDHNWNVAPESHVDGEHLHDVVRGQLIAGVDVKRTFFFITEGEAKYDKLLEESNISNASHKYQTNKKIA
jgi:hypothetical protein